MEPEIFFKIQKSFFTNDYKTTEDLILRLESQTLLTPEHKIDVQKFCISKFVEIYTQTGEYLKLKSKIEDYLSSQNLRNHSGKLEFTTFDVSNSNFIETVFQSYYNVLCLLDEKKNIDILKSQNLEIKNHFPKFASFLEITDVGCNTTVQEKPQICHFEFTETAQSVILNISAKNVVFGEVKINAQNNQKLTIFTDSFSESLELALANGVEKVEIVSKSHSLLSLILTKSKDNLWNRFLSDNSKNYVIINKTIYEKPVNPYVSKKNWDKIVEEEEKEALKEKDYDGIDPSMHFFREIYQNADEDTKRAMMKSYTESDGKALSTNWKEVAEKNYKKEL